MEEVCPDVWFLNYTNPMASITGAMLTMTGVKTVGLCHSVQGCASGLLRSLNMDDQNIQWKIAGINHQAWLLEITRDGQDLYPEIKRRAALKNQGKLEIGSAEETIARYEELYGELSENWKEHIRKRCKLYQETGKHDDMVRFELMRHFGYYITESSEHNAEYTPYFIKDKYPELIDRFNIPLDEYRAVSIRLRVGTHARRAGQSGVVAHIHGNMPLYFDAMKPMCPSRLTMNLAPSTTCPAMPVLSALRGGSFGRGTHQVGNRGACAASAAPTSACT